MNTQELRKQDTKELEKSVVALKKQLSDIRFKLSGNQMKNVKEVSNIKKKIARMLTIIKESTLKKVV